MSEPKCPKTKGARSQHGCECRRILDELKALRAFLRQQETAPYVPDKNHAEIDPEDDGGRGNAECGMWNGGSRACGMARCGSRAFGSGRLP